MNSYKPVVLLMEENKEDVIFLKKCLEDSSSKITIEHTATLFEGIDLIKNKTIDLVFLNFNLQDSSGFKTLSKFIEKCPNIPVIVLTETGNEVLGNQAIKAGAQDFLVKKELNKKFLGRATRYALQRFKTQHQLKELSQSLSINQKRFVEAQEMANFGNWEMDIVSSKMIWTDEIFRIFGCQPQSFEPSLSEFLSYVHHDDKDAVEAFFENAGNTSDQVKIDHRIVTDGKNIKYIALQSKVYVEEYSSRIKLVGAIQDITERKNNEFLSMEKIISKGMIKVKEQMLTDMSFQIRTPLNSIVNLMHLLENSAMSHKQSELLDGLKNSIDDLFGSVNNLLNYSMVGIEKISETKTEFALKEFLNSVNKMLVMKAEVNGSKIKINMEADMPERVLTFPKKTTQLFYNLVGLALADLDKNTKRKLDIRIANAQGSKTFEVSLSGSIPSFMSEDVINMINNGDHKTLLEIIEKDGKLDILSLAIMNKLILLLNGKLKLNLGVDEDFLNISIPIEVVKQISSNTKFKPFAPIRILLVEDHFLNQISTKKVLTSWSNKVSVDIAENGLIAFEKYKEHGYDLILMDIQMPVMNGFESSLKIREISQVPIIALTANASSQEETKCKEIGINDYMTKPFKPEALQAKIMNLMVLVPKGNN